MPTIFSATRPGCKRPLYRHNIPGFNVGGPMPVPSFGEGGPSLLRDKVFFFFSNREASHNHTYRSSFRYSADGFGTDRELFAVDQ